MEENNKISKLIEESIIPILKCKEISNEIKQVKDIIIDALKNKNKIILFGNGGSAADSQHMAAEFIGRFLVDRQSIPAISLTTDTSILTAVGNDFGFENIFSRQCESLVSKGDIIIAISTSGNSQNVINGIKMAKKKGAKIISLLGNNGGKIKKVSDISIIVNSSSTQKIQEVHRVIYHIICQNIEEELKNDV